jgi:hypothetical protein
MDATEVVVIVGAKKQSRRGLLRQASPCALEALMEPSGTARARLWSSWVADGCSARNPARTKLPIRHFNSASKGSLLLDWVLLCGV